MKIKHAIKALLKVIRIKIGILFGFMRNCHHEWQRSIILKKFDIHPSVRWGIGTEIYGEGKISIGEGTYIGQNSFIQCYPKDAKLTIGEFCAISHSVHIRTESHRKIQKFEDEKKMPPYGKDVSIGDYVWIGAHVFIRGGITIGSNSIIGANSVVTKDIPPNCVYAGTPAKLINKKENYPKLTQGSNYEPSNDN